MHVELSSLELAPAASDAEVLTGPVNEEVLPGLSLGNVTWANAFKRAGSKKSSPSAPLQGNNSPVAVSLLVSRVSVVMLTPPATKGGPDEEVAHVQGSDLLVESHLFPDPSAPGCRDSLMAKTASLTLVVTPAVFRAISCIEVSCSLMI